MLNLGKSIFRVKVETILIIFTDLSSEYYLTSVSKQSYIRVNNMIYIYIFFLLNQFRRVTDLPLVFLLQIILVLMST